MVNVEIIATIYINPKLHICDNCNISYINNYIYGKKYNIYDKVISCLQNEKLINLNHSTTGMIQTCSNDNNLLKLYNCPVENNLPYGRLIHFDKKIEFPITVESNLKMIISSKTSKLLFSNLEDYESFYLSF